MFICPQNCRLGARRNVTLPFSMCWQCFNSTWYQTPAVCPGLLVLYSQRHLKYTNTAPDHKGGVGEKTFSSEATYIFTCCLFQEACDIESCLIKYRCISKSNGITVKLKFAGKLMARRTCKKWCWHVQCDLLYSKKCAISSVAISNHIACCPNRYYVFIWTCISIKKIFFM